MHKPSRSDIDKFLLYFVIALAVTALSFTLAKYAYDHNLLMFAH